ncbi:hypothetical protein OG756_33750 [Streptomyces sp. NBC_01310]|nr:hypothetical protein OG756_33750 [Streptomyces sp. NBC_01310]
MTAAALGAWIVFEDEAGFLMTPSRATWARRSAVIDGCLTATGLH